MIKVNFGKNGFWVGVGTSNKIIQRLLEIIGGIGLDSIVCFVSNFRISGPLDEEILHVARVHSEILNMLEELVGLFSDEWIQSSVRIDPG